MLENKGIQIVFEATSMGGLVVSSTRQLLLPELEPDQSEDCSDPDVEHRLKSSGRHRPSGLDVRAGRSLRNRLIG